MNRYVSLFYPVPIISLIAIAGCSQLGPSNADIKKELQAELPAYLEVTSLDVKERENTGSKVDPNIQARFKVTIKMKEDTFRRSLISPTLHQTRKPLQEVIFLNREKRKDEVVELYGLLASQKFEDSWKTSFKYDSTVIVGEPRSSFVGKTVINSSPEEEAYNKEVAEQVKAEKNELLSLLLNKEVQGQWVNYNGQIPFKISLTSGNSGDDKIVGKIAFDKGAVKGFEGTLTPKEMKFTINRVIQGEDNFGIGTVYTFPLREEDIKQGKINGSWIHTNSDIGSISIYLQS